MQLANFTLHDQSEHIDEWRKFGFDMDPTPKAPLIEFEKEGWTEEAILDAVTNELGLIQADGFNAILIGGLSNCMAYAWLLAPRFGLQVVMARTPRKRTPDGRFVFELAGYATLLPPPVVWNWPDTRILDQAMKDTRKYLIAGDSLQAVDSLVIALEALEEMIVRE